MKRGIFLEFPLCLLAMNTKTEKELAGIILHFAIVEYSKKIVLTEYDNDLLQEVLNGRYLNDILPEDLENVDFDEPNDTWGYYRDENQEYFERYARVLQTMQRLNLECWFLSDAFKAHSNASHFINRFNTEFGAQPYCRVNADFVIEAYLGKARFDLFRVQAAISAILGRKDIAKRITYDRIACGMHGFKSNETFGKAMFLNDKNIRIPELLTDKAIKNRTDILCRKNFFSKFTYGRRHIYYSTHIKTHEALAEWVAELKIKQEKAKPSNKDYEATANIKARIQEMKDKHRGKIVNINRT